MTTVNPTTSTTGLQGLAGATGDAAMSKTSADFNMFLKMLTTQMQNQDPLDPMDTSEYTQQLVQYSQVEQTIQQTGTLKDILASLSTQDMAQASGFIGREAEFASALSGLTEAKPAHWAFTADRAVSSVVATITNEAGTVVDTRPIDARQAGSYVWNGTLANGTRAAGGTYSLTLKATDANGGNVPMSIKSIGAVDEVVSKGGKVTMGVNGAQLPIGTLVKVMKAA